jgi:hypothetical protein
MYLAGLNSILEGIWSLFKLQNQRILAQHNASFEKLLNSDIFCLCFSRFQGMFQSKHKNLVKENYVGGLVFWA